MLPLAVVGDSLKPKRQMTGAVGCDSSSSYSYSTVTRKAKCTCEKKAVPRDVREKAKILFIKRERKGDGRISLSLSLTVKQARDRPPIFP